MTAVSALLTTLLHSLWFGSVLAALAPLAGICGASLRTRVVIGRVATIAWILISIATCTICLFNAPPAITSPPHASQTAAGLFAAWIAGAFAQMGQLGWGALRLRRWIQKASPASPELHEMAKRWAKRFDLAKLPKIVVSDDFAVPAATGILRPIIMLPNMLSERFCAERVELIVAHELFHLKRRDPVFVGLELMLRCAYFFHPAFWWLQKYNRLQRELLCDATISHSSGASLTYAATLLELEESRRLSPWVTAATSELSSRLSSLLGTSFPTMKNKRYHIFRKPSFWVLAIFLISGAWISTRMIESRQRDANAIIAPKVVAYWDAIQEAARPHNIDPRLIAAMVHVESRGNPLARSYMDARGLMQLMPATAQEVSRKLGEKLTSPEALNDARFNLRLGSAYFAEQIERFSEGRTRDEGITLAVAAYNAGPKRLRAVLDGEGELPTQTVRYQAKVLSIWRQLQSNPDSPLTILPE